ncbi:MAG: hypothetical protein PHF44_04735 [Candidatus Pacebacteria bacterium]|nr:hypothetical protein [Candidatus Paceibacterota bacterium]
MFKVTIEGKEVGDFDTFIEAFKTFFDKVKEIIDRGTPWQMLETACWIECNGKNPIGFYAVKNLAYAIGLLKDGKLQDSVRELPQDIMESVFHTLHTTACINDCLEIIKRVTRHMSNVS